MLREQNQAIKEELTVERASLQRAYAQLREGGAGRWREQAETLQAQLAETRREKTQLLHALECLSSSTATAKTTSGKRIKSSKVAQSKVKVPRVEVKSRSKKVRSRPRTAVHTRRGRGGKGRRLAK